MGAYLSSPITDKEVFEGDGHGLRFGGGAMQGWRRTMEDAHVAEVNVANDPNVAMFGVFDGHGGAEVAKFCQKYMAAELQRFEEFGKGSVEDSLVKVFHRMDEMLRDQRYAEELEKLKSKESNEDEGEGEGGGVSTTDALDLLRRVFQLKRFVGGNSNSMGEGGSSEEPAESPEEELVQAGCTAVVAVKFGNELFVANAGDSRGVLCRAGKAVALSEDHKPAQEGERSRIIAAGGFLSEIGGVCRVNGNLNLSRAIGDLKYKTNNELPPSDQIITAQPDIRKIALSPEDRFFLLACDGVWDVMSNQDAVDFVSARLDQGMTPSQASCALLDACLASDPKEARGVGCDNMTVVVVQLNSPSSS
ncbi:hypothetical protein CHLRE_09g410600v5 [Chlamydomonas reinhardtii]|uniref:protein-serine/threonine phosphatase n=1 Tax=Chlamydomonas reinhardtii TaxID=3055 RepID=A8J4N7_CHLRE|nr:uncharacterized protein CHLRE_09g410600v5 [Chlamydomonas reinhardtii]PNW79315.1 hypothetical protein CHLRE_09g410600v5 [Chlamydomonas reinhardtii]|eukprot:XP_001696785.1 protein phosphatase 2C [Chlamydomonas reinhardtii]